MSKSSPAPDPSDLPDASALDAEGVEAFEYLYEKYGPDTDVGRIAATVLQSASESDDEKEATN